MEKAEVDSLIIQNAHRIPRNPDNRYKETAPEAIIVKFACLKDRNTILARVHEVKLPKGKSVRTDLPGPMKKKRAQLAQKAYQLRKEGLITQILKNLHRWNFKSDVQESTDGPGMTCDSVFQCRIIGIEKP